MCASIWKMFFKFRYLIYSIINIEEEFKKREAHNQSIAEVNEWRPYEKKKTKNKN